MCARYDCRSFSFLTVLLSLLLLMPLGAFAAAESGRLNVVVLLADDLGWGDLSLHGGKVPTPNLDRFFKQGVELETFLVMPVCSPTRAAFLTGRHPARVGVNPNTVNARVGEMMNPRETTLAEVFQSAGYKTALVGKWHLGYAPSDPNSKGFDLFYGFLGAATDYMKRTDDPHTRWMLNDEPAPDPGYSTDIIRNRSVRYIAENKASAFFLCVAFNAVHNPVQASEHYIARAPASIQDRHARERAGMVIALDDAVGAIVKQIDDEKLAERTVIVFFSDNGPTPDGDAGPFRGRKHTIWEGGVRSPTAVRWTGQIKPGSSTRAMLAADDLFPTLLKLAEVPAPKNVVLDGYDFSACLTSGAPSPRQEAYWIWMDCDSIRTARHKMVRYADRKELYDLEKDIAEAKDVASQHPKIVADMEKRLDAWLASVPIYPTHVAVKGPHKAQPAGDVLELRARRIGGQGKQILGISLGSCESFQVGAGDRLEFDILIAEDSAREGLGIDYRHPERQKKKGQLRGSVADDEEGVATGTGVLEQRKGQWTRRVIGLANRAGRMVDTLWLSIEGHKPADYHLYLDNVIIRRADGSVIEFYRDGAAPAPGRRASEKGYSNVSLTAVPLAKITSNR
jgi:arylsulfatase A-like enzyme